MPAPTHPGRAPSRPARTGGADGALPGARARTSTNRLALTVAVLAVAALMLVSAFTGVYDITPVSLFTDPEHARVFAVTRLPRTFALVLTAVAMSVSGVIMQMLTQNRFVEPTTIGTAQWAGLGILIGLVVWPQASLTVRMLLAIVCSFAGTLLFMALLQRIRLRSSLIVPLVGIMLSAVVSAVTTYIATAYDLLQSLGALRTGSFADVVRGRYEVLWVVLAVVVIAYIAADRFTIAGLGRDVATSVGLNHTRVVLLGTLLVALCTGVTTVVVGILPFVGLIVPNIVAMIRGDDVRSNLPWAALAGVALVLVCDIIGRVIRMPYEIPASVVLGVVGAAVFIALIVRRRHLA